VVEDQKLCAVLDSRLLKTAADLRTLVDCDLPAAFHTADLAAALDVPRHFAQRIAYCLRETGAARVAGKRGNTHLYEWPASVRRRRRAA
jgi:hypothetical protein